MKRALGVLLLAMLLSCGSGEEPQAVDPDTIDQSNFDEFTASDTCEGIPLSEDCVEPRQNALRLDAEDRLGFEEIAYDRQSSSIRMRLKEGAKLPEKIKVGAPIYRARGDREAFMAIVTAVDQRDRDVRVTVRQAKLKEVFKRGRLRLSVPIQTDPEVMVEQERIEEMRRRIQPISVDLIDYDCRTTILDQTVSGFAQSATGESIQFGATADIKLELVQCNVVLTGNVDARLEWDGITPDLFEFSLGADLAVAFEVLAELSNIDTVDGNFDVIDTIGHGSRIIKFPSWTVPVAGIQVKFEPEIWAGVRFVASDNVDASAGFEFDASASAGFGWSGGAGFYPIFDSSRSFTQLGPNIEQTDYSYVRAYVRPQINVTLSGLRRKRGA